MKMVGMNRALILRLKPFFDAKPNAKPLPRLHVLMETFQICHARGARTIAWKLGK